jgi:hypothetical protein
LVSPLRHRSRIRKELPLPPCHERKPLEEVHILFVLKKRTVEFRQAFLGSPRRFSGWMSLATSSLIQSSASDVEGFFFRPGTSRIS